MTMTSGRTVGFIFPHTVKEREVRQDSRESTYQYDNIKHKYEAWLARTFAKIYTGHINGDLICK
jgi:hypothetical protein